MPTHGVHESAVHRGKVQGVGTCTACGRARDVRSRVREVLDHEPVPHMVEGGRMCEKVGEGVRRCEKV